MIRLFEIYDGIKHWVWGQGEEQVKKFMDEIYRDWYGEDSPDWDMVHKDLVVTELPRDKEFSLMLDSGKEIRLTVQEWGDLAWLFRSREKRKEPIYFACSEW